MLIAAGSLTLFACLAPAVWIRVRYKYSSQKIATCVGVTIATGSAVTGAALAGLAVAGPVGIAIGAIIGAAAVGTVGRKAAVPTGILTELWRSLMVQPEVFGRLPVIGVVRIDRPAPSIPLALANIEAGVNSSLYRVVTATVNGLGIETVRAGEALSAKQQQALEKAVEILVSEQAIAIVSDSGLLMQYQQSVAVSASAPVLLSPLLQTPLLISTLSPQQVILILTAEAMVQRSQSDLESMLLQTGLLGSREDASRCILVSCKGLPGFSLDADIPFVASDTESALVNHVWSAIQQYDVGAVLIESAMLPVLSDVLRKALSCPVFVSSHRLASTLRKCFIFTSGLIS